jgi:hypothetical protein
MADTNGFKLPQIFGTDQNPNESQASRSNAAGFKLIQHTSPRGMHHSK